MIVYLASAVLSPTNAALLRACRQAGADAIHVPPRIVGQRAQPGDRVLARLDVLPSLDGVEDGIWELGRLEEHDVTLLNSPSALLAAHDKLATAVKLGSAGIPHPRTAHVEDEAPDLDLEFPVVVKPRFGSWGKDVLRCLNRHELRRSIRALGSRPWFRRQGALVQELVPSPEHDLRIVVARGEVTGAIERWALPGEWRTSVALGATRRPADPPAEARALALAAAAAIGSDLVGVDLLPLLDGSWMVLELNAAVDFTAAYGLGGHDPFDETVRALGLAAPEQRRRYAVTAGASV
jgi:[lysine-biosynthesis-protein LysW]--L-2-aminoadipate ligase